MDQDRFMSNLTTVRSNNWHSYDDITRMSLEITFHSYFKSNSDLKYRYVDINPNCKVDLKDWVEVDNDDNFIRKKIKRVKINYRERPKLSKRYTDSNPFLMDLDNDSGVKNYV